MIEGDVCREPEFRYSPAGVPIGRFTIEHHSSRIEAGMERDVYCRIGVVAAGTELEPRVRVLQTTNRVIVHGFIHRAVNRRGEARLVLHAEAIEPID